MFFQDTSGQSTPSLGGNSNAHALSQMGFNNFIHHMATLDWVVFIALCIMSLMSWYFIIANFIRNAMVRSRAEKVIRAFWDAGSAQDSIRAMEEQPKGEPFSKIALDCASAAAHHQRSDSGRLAESLDRSEFIDRALRQSIARESVRLEGGLTVLATVGSAAVFVGLLGTVWGIYHALIGIGASGQASITAVAGPVGEALIMTAFGLFTAIPAVLAYNFYVRSNRITFARFDEFAHDLHDFFATGSRVGEESDK
ncbi:MAG TPA: MotA/TolQ/ExbB proton channel family protein [Rhodanobacteraceae bacterium]